MDQPAHIALLQKSLASFRPTLSPATSADRLEVKYNDKSVVVLWPTLRGEVFLDFVEHGRMILTGSIEYYEAESPETQAEDVARVARNFLLHEAKVVNVGFVLKRSELQSYREGKWSSVFQ